MTTFDPIADTNWPYQHGFGVFLFNAVEYLGRHGDVLTRRQRTPGQALAVHLPKDAEDIRLETPDGEMIEWWIYNRKIGSW